MLRRLKTDESAAHLGSIGRPAPDSGGNGDEEGNGRPRSHSAGSMSSLQRYRSQTMKDYGLMIEYKHLRQHVPSGIYVLPAFDHPRTWYGTIFIHAGLYRNGVFKFTIHLPDNYNGPGTYPRIVFSTSVFHPYVDAETKELDLKPKFPLWDPELHYMVAVLSYLKSIFYMKEFPQQGNVASPTALEIYRRDQDKYVAMVEACVEESVEQVYTNESGSAIRFTKPSPAHENLRRELFSQLNPNNNSIPSLASTSSIFSSVMLASHPLTPPTSLNRPSDAASTTSAAPAMEDALDEAKPAAVPSSERDSSMSDTTTGNDDKPSEP